jgi:hypothetical protein
MGGHAFTANDMEGLGKLAKLVFGAIVFFGIGLLVVWFLLILSLAGLAHLLPLPVQDGYNVLVAFGISLAMFCAVLWVANSVGIVRLNEKANKIIGTTIAVGTLTAVSAAIGKGIEFLIP